ncbi:MAG: FMN-dependent NADH-azoreductase [Comamonadaceae bacterium]|nr:FMN-dependent NADH-azoreductase [Comamonadaceae bacterium]
MNILQINSSARRLQDDQGSISTRLANELTAGLRAAHPAATVTVRDFAVSPLPVLDEAALGALFTPAEARSAEQAARVALNDQLIAELLAADVVVLGVPMINFNISAQLKNWIDAVARAGVTFKYGEQGPVGLVTGKKVYVVSARGGIHRDQPTDQVVPYLRTVLAFLGMTDVEFIYAEGLNMGPEIADRGLNAARDQIRELLAA